MSDSPKGEERLKCEEEALSSPQDGYERLKTAHRRIADALDESERRYRTLMENAPLGIVVCDQRGQITDVNPALLTILGSPSAEATRAINILTFPPLIEAGVAEDFGRCLKTGTPLVSEHPYNTKWGKQIYLRYHLSPLRNDKNEVQAVLGIAEDFTARKNAEDAAQRANEQLMRKAEELQLANEELNQYAAAVSHDVKAPLRAIRHYVEILKEDFGETLVGEPGVYLGKIIKAIRQAENLVEDLLQLSRISERSATLEDVDLELFLRELVVGLELPEKTELVWQGKWTSIRSDPVLLRQIFQNLILNAVKFNRSEYIRITLDCRRSAPGYLEISVKDNGIGIDPRYHERIFNVFERLHTRAEYEGTGIGLALVKKATAKLRGSVRVESNLGEGATFVVTLPFNE